MINYSDVPPIGLAGHTVGGKEMNVEKEVKRLKESNVRGCPVNRRLKTRLLRKVFIQMCLKFQKQAGVFNNKSVKGASSTPTGWKTNNVIMCNKCKKGKAIREKRSWKPPAGVTLISKKELYETETKEQGVRQSGKRTYNKGSDVDIGKDVQSSCEFIDKRVLKANSEGFY